MVNPSEIKNLYERLNVSQNASESELKQAYRTLAHQWHPDKNPGRESESRIEFIAVSEAYKELSVDAQRVFSELPKSERNEEFYKFYDEIMKAMEEASPGISEVLKAFGGSSLPPSFEAMFGELFRK
jgi:DnaJ-class molecular chaperone